MSPYTIVLCKFTHVLVKKQLEIDKDRWERHPLRKRGLTLCLWVERQLTIYGLEVGKIVFFEKCVQVVHSNVFLYFTGLPVSSSFNHYSV